MGRNVPGTRVFLRPLTKPEEDWCVHYFSHGDKFAATKRAFDCSQLTDARIGEKACRMLNRAAVRMRLQQLRDAAAALAMVSESEVLREAAHIGFSDPLGLIDARGNLRSLHEMTPAVRAAIASIELEEERVEILDAEGKATGKRRISTRVKKVRFWDKNSAIEKLMKHLGMFERDNAQRRNGIFDKLPPAEAREIQEYLLGLEQRDREVAGNAKPGHAGHTTH